MGHIVEIFWSGRILLPRQTCSFFLCQRKIPLLVEGDLCIHGHISASLEPILTIWLLCNLCNCIQIQKLYSIPDSDLKVQGPIWYTCVLLRMSVQNITCKLVQQVTHASKFCCIRTQVELFSHIMVSF